MADGQDPALAVIEDMDGEAAIGRGWGEVHALVHKQVFRLEGAVTQTGGARSGRLPEGFPISLAVVRSKPRFCPCAPNRNARVGSFG